MPGLMINQLLITKRETIGISLTNRSIRAYIGYDPRSDLWNVFAAVDGRDYTMGLCTFASHHDAQIGFDELIFEKEKYNPHQDI